MVAGILSVSMLLSQSSFEVASVRQNKLEDRIVTINVGPGGRFSARGYTLALLMQRAYGVMDWNIEGGPAWIRTDRFDIVATAVVDGNLQESQLQSMLQRLLAERFQLAVHKGSKEIAGHALVVAKGGLKAKPAKAIAEQRDSFYFGSDGLEGHGVTMRDFARWVSGKLGWIAVDQTGLSGPYDFKADWKFDPNRANGDAKEEFRPIVMDALEAQLGLKMVRQKIRIETVVIDHVERLSEN